MPENNAQELIDIFVHLDKETFGPALAYLRILAALRLKNPDARETLRPEIFHALPDEIKIQLGEIASFYFEVHKPHPTPPERM